MSLNNKNVNLFIACFPKSGSSYLRTLLCNITGFKRATPVQFFGHNEQDLFEKKVKELYGKCSVAQQHVKGTNNNVRLFKKYKIKPIILVRNIFDIVLSLGDHIDKGGKRKVVTSNYVHEEYFSMSKEEKWMYLIKIALPWYFNFYVSWRKASDKMDVLWLSYEELFSNQADTVAKIFDFYDMPINRNEINLAISKMGSKKQGWNHTKLNVGIAGRGVKLLPKSHIDAVYDLADVWKIDREEMKLIGLGKANDK